MAPTNQGLPPELVKLAEQLGVDPAALAGLSGGAVDDSPPVWVGEKRTPRPRRTVRTDDPNRRFEVTPAGEDVSDRLQTSQQTYMRFWEWDDKKLRQFQEDAFNAGLYGTNKRERVRFGDRDADTERIWRDMVDRAASFYAVGQKVSPWDALKLAAKADPGIEPEEGPEPPKLVNALDIRALGNTRGKARLGRELTDEEHEKLTARFREMEAAGNAEDGTVSAPDPEVWADQEVKRLDPVRFGARNVLSSFDAIIGALGGTA